MRVLVAQVTDAADNNAQILNARALLPRFADPSAHWVTLHYNAPDSALVSAPNVSLVRLLRTRLWKLHKFAFYQRPADAIFYPGPYWFDDLALLFRRWTGRRVPIVATLEGLVGDEMRERELTSWRGHPVSCHRIPRKLLARIDRVMTGADHIIAISPFLAEAARRLYGDKRITALPLGIDSSIFYSIGRRAPERFTVVGAGTLNERKRPQFFLQLARQFPAADFIWYGDGELRAQLIQEKSKLGLTNVDFPGALPNRDLGVRFRNASLFVLPSLAEGVPKVTQEAAACGLPIVIFGQFEAPTVIDGENGFVVWDDAEALDRVGLLVNAPKKAEEMGVRSVEMAKEWSWDVLAPKWERCILGAIRESR